LNRNNDGEDIWFSSEQGIQDLSIPGEQKSCLEKMSGFHLYKEYKIYAYLESRKAPWRRYLVLMDKEYRIYVYLESRKAAWRRYLVLIWTRNTGSMYTWRAEKLPGEDIWFSSGQGIQDLRSPGSSLGL